MIIERETTASVAPSNPPNPTRRLPVLPSINGAIGLRTASLGGSSGVTGALSDLFDQTFSSAAQQSEPVAAALAGHIAGKAEQDNMRRPELIAPDLEHVADVFVAAQPLTSDYFAQIWDHDEADFSPATELGNSVPVLRAGDFPEGLSHTRFVPLAPAPAATN